MADQSNIPLRVADFGWEIDTSLHVIIGEAVGAGSMCWQFPERAGVFNSKVASEIVEAVLEIIRKKQIGV